MPNGAPFAAATAAAIDIPEIEALETAIPAWPWRLKSTRDGEIARWRRVNPDNEFQAYEAEVIDQDGDDSVWQILDSRRRRVVCCCGAPDFETALEQATEHLTDFI